MIEACRLGERDISASSAPPRENIFFVRWPHLSPAEPSLPLPMGEERGSVAELVEEAAAGQQHPDVVRHARAAFADNFR
jgi:hypothetical protein